MPAPVGRPTASTCEIYALCDPVSGEIRYVGKANCSVKRLTGHLRDAKRKDTPVCRWIRKLGISSLVPALQILETVPASEWKDAERRLIGLHRAAGTRLLNVADGGDQPFCPLEVRQRNGRGNAASIHGAHADPKRKAMWKLLQSLGVSLKKGWASEASKEKMRQHPDIFGSLMHLL